MSKDLTDAQFVRLQMVLALHAGLQVPEHKRRLVTERVLRLRSALGITDLDAYLDRVEAGRESEELVQLVNAMTTNHTWFFREPDQLRAVADDLMARRRVGGPPLHVWSAACSTGAEPYSLAMELLERAPVAPEDVLILATDIDTEALGHAAEGVYTEREAAHVPPELRSRYMRPIGACWTVQPVVRRLLRFGRINLLSPTFPIKGPFEAILCRNVLIYFDPPTRAAVIKRLAALLADEGMLVIGGSEIGLRDGTDGLLRVGPGVFRKPPALRRARR